MKLKKKKGPEKYYLKSGKLAMYMGIIFTELYQEYNNKEFIL